MFLAKKQKEIDTLNQPTNIVIQISFKLTCFNFDLKIKKTHESNFADTTRRFHSTNFVTTNYF